ncbi:unnamed protein product [Orchesella dallaii]|uniref:C2H2-type domain-containing protein n=1 Tax=Orchesella dallaii TaxID=48710 RepID=A0ABP1RQN6_9HEXA
MNLDSMIDNFNFPPHQENGNEMYSNEDQDYQDENDTAAEVEDQDLTADPNVVSRALVIANENDETGVTSVIQIIKQEALAPGTNPYEPEDGEVYLLANRKRRFLYEGIEIFRASGTGRFASTNYLQCGECCYTVSLPKNSSRLASRYTIIKTHILHAHKKKTGAPKRSRQREYVCASQNRGCGTDKATHTPDEIVKCDICMKPMSGTISVSNFLAHKFSHKNDEERRIAFANGEKGASACLLSTRKNHGNVGCSTPTPKRVLTKSVRRQVNQPKQTQGAEGCNNTANEYCCELCNRTFARKCHLARHRMSQHLKQQ